MGKGLFDRLEGELEARDQSLGLRMVDLLTIPEPLSGMLNWMMRQGQVSLADISAFRGQDEVSTRTLLAEGVSKGFVREIDLRGAMFYRVRLAAKRGRDLTVDLWQAMENKCTPGEEGRQ